MEAYLQHGKWGGPYQTEKVPVKQTEPPRSGATVSGYGKRLPTSYMVRYGKRWLRVRCSCYSNNGTLWARVNGVDTVVTVYGEG